MISCAFAAAVLTARSPEHAAEDKVDDRLMHAIESLRVHDFRTAHAILGVLCPSTMDDAIKGAKKERVPCMLIVDAEAEGMRSRTADRLSLLYWHAADVARKSGDLAPARELYRVAIDRYPAGPDNWYWLGIVQRELGQMDESDQALRKALELRPNDRDTLYWLATNAIDTGRYDEARTILDGLIQRNEKDGRAWYRKGELSLHQGECSKAKEDFEKAESLGVDVRKAREPMKECKPAQEP